MASRHSRALLLAGCVKANEKPYLCVGICGNVFPRELEKIAIQMAAGESESPSSHGGGSVSPPPRAHRNGTKEVSTRNSRKTESKIIQVANIAPQATREQMQTLFGFIGKIDDLRLYPSIDLGLNITSKICFVKFYDGAHVSVAQHYTNTVFIDRALIVIPYIDGEIPDEQKALELLGSGTLLPGIADPKLPQHVTSQLEGLPPNQFVATIDPKLIEGKLPSYPPLPPTHDTRKIEEIRRTILVANIDTDLKSEEVVEYFSRAGEVKYFRFCTRDNDPLHYALIEFSDQPSILDALRLNGTKLGSKRINVVGSLICLAQSE
ncbi:unnamed protein product [Allacma fusca]|uniref:RRM domain-containing protein n=1 Tax=Allacma fusca TaxID=39272 RepID=A0A8J2LXV1_9HEXA|nr:unnamed protein product [Allacma fusca]